jgi:hypothetical protein
LGAAAASLGAGLAALAEEPGAPGIGAINGRPVERSGGGALPRDFRDIDPKTGEQKGTAVLSAEERAKGFVRPVRDVYTHLRCGTNTRMSADIAETLARDPKFYSGGFCVHCRGYFPLSEFVWKDTTITVGT